MKVKFFQQGGEMPSQNAEMPANAGANPQAQIENMAMEIINQVGPEGAAALAQAIITILQSNQPQPQEAPTYQRKGGKLVILGKN